MNKRSLFFFSHSKRPAKQNKILKPALLFCLYFSKFFLWESENKLAKQHLCKYMKQAPTTACRKVTLWVTWLQRSPYTNQETRNKQLS